LIHQIQFVLILLLLFIIGFGTLAQWLKTPYPIVLVVGGLLLSFVPGLPRISLDPDLVFLAILPPLLFFAAAETSWRDFRHNLVTILSLAFGLVGFTVLGVSLAAHWLIPGFDWKLGLVLGATIAPTDAIAATAIAKRVGLPHRIVDVLEGESLVNDATGLLALEFSTALVVNAQMPSLEKGLVRLAVLVVGGIAVGLITGRLVRLVERYIDNAPIEVTVSIVTPYLAYMGAEALHTSGVLATVAVGLYLGRQSSSLFSSRVRIELQSFWNTLTFLLNALVFLLIGLQLPYILQGIRGITLGELFTSAAELAISVVLLRLIWVFPGAYVGDRIRSKLLHQRTARLSRRSVFVVGWTGMRGVVSLAAALALPATLSNGQPFPHRSELLFLTFSVILVTLVLQGLTLPGLIRALKLSDAGKPNVEEREARRAMLLAALKELEKMRAADSPEYSPIYDNLAQLYQHRLASVPGEEEEQDSSRALTQRYRAVSTKLRAVERATVIEMRNRKEISDAVMRKIEREIDLLDVRFSRE
jgi:CPA1 family monovalent cation:H+ antiporter